MYKGNKVPSCTFGLYCSLYRDDEASSEDNNSESSDELPITADFSDGYVDNDNEMSEVESDSDESNGGEREEEELKVFDVDMESLVALLNLLELQMPSEVFLMYLISLQFISFLCVKAFR